MGSPGDNAGSDEGVNDGKVVGDLGAGAAGGEAEGRGNPIRSVSIVLMRDWSSTQQVVVDQDGVELVAEVRVGTGVDNPDKVADSAQGTQSMWMVVDRRSSQ